MRRSFLHTVPTAQSVDDDDDDDDDDDIGELLMRMLVLTILARGDSVPHWRRRNSKWGAWRRRPWAGVAIRLGDLIEQLSSQRTP